MNVVTFLVNCSYSFRQGKSIALNSERRFSEASRLFSAIRAAIFFIRFTPYFCKGKIHLSHKNSILQKNLANFPLTAEALHRTRDKKESITQSIITGIKNKQAFFEFC